MLPRRGDGGKVAVDTSEASALGGQFGVRRADGRAIMFIPVHLSSLRWKVVVGHLHQTQAGLPTTE